MPASLASFTATVEKLIRRFESDRTHYLSKNYSEAQARVDFITPFFKALGWDVENEGGLAHHAREVVVELGEDTHGRPDYGFRLTGQTKFFVEAKAPSEALDSARHIMQAKKYAWNTKQVFFVVLTDFEEFRFYDASIIPDERKPDEGLLLNFRYTDYLSHIAKLWEFSPERVAAGSLEAMLPRDRRTQRLRIPVDTAFLDEMTEWREELAKNIYKNNPALTARQLNEVVQRLLDRIVFIRVAEDRRVIEKNQLRDVVEEWKARGGKFHIFEGLNDLFHRINEDFNGEIFKPHLSEEIKIDSDVLARIIERLYPPKSPYRFDVIGVELLGSIYERYLGNTIRATAKQVRVEEKPEVRKAGGVYYTPKYIVDYIVKNTVGKLIEGKTPKQIEKIRILDPACGSGSFLIGAFQCLIDYHARYLAEHPKEAQVHALFPDITKDANGEPHLSVIRKAQILKNNLFGVDIDPQAVEITMMSLYLKALEGERSQLPPKQHLLPELKNNIICGNSLIGPDFYKDEQLSFLDDEEKYRVNAFDWQAGFPEIVKAGGFDAVIGNPPYLGGREWKEEGGRKYEYLIQNFTVAEYQFDIYVLFWERGIRLLKQGGRIGLITPNTWLNNRGDTKLRQFILQKTKVVSITDYSRMKVFSQGVVLPIITVLERKDYPSSNVELYLPDSGKIILSHRIPQNLWEDGEFRIFNIGLREQDILIRKKVERNSVKLESIADVKFGIKLYETGKGIPPQKPSDAERHVFEANKKLGAQFCRYLEGKDVNRYQISWNNRWLKYGENLAAPRDPQLFEGRRLLVRRIVGERLIGTFTDEDFVTSQLLQIVKPHDQRIAKYLLGILNSSLLAYHFKKKYNRQDKTFPEIRIYELASLPVRLPDLSESANEERHRKLVAFVDGMLELNKKKHSGKLAPSELDRLEREISATDAQIDDLVYDLYGISAEERKIIEEGKG